MLDVNRMPRSKPIKITDSERSASTSLANSIQDMILDKTVKLLDKNEKTVVHKICLNQKLVLRRHQQKVHESQMNHAKIVGDKRLEQELRRKYRDAGANASMDDMEEADEKLIKLWRQGKEDLKVLKQQLEKTKTRRPSLRSKSSLLFRSEYKSRDRKLEEDEYPDCQPIRRPLTSMSLIRPIVKRSTTSMSVNLPCRRSITGNLKNVPGVRASTSMSMANPERRKSVVFVLNEEDRSKTRPGTSVLSADGPKPTINRKKSSETQDLSHDATKVNSKLEENLNHNSDKEVKQVISKPITHQPIRRPKTSLGLSIVLKPKKNQVQGQEDTRISSRKSTLPAFFDIEEEEKPSLLAVHKERVKSANYLTRIDNFVDNVKIWKADERDIIQDYYYAGQVEKNKHNYIDADGAADGERRTSMKPAERSKHTGDFRVRSLTFPKLDV